jgi:hypothetical protein
MASTRLMPSDLSRFRVQLDSLTIVSALASSLAKRRILNAMSAEEPAILISSWIAAADENAGLKSS